MKTNVKKVIAATAITVLAIAACQSIFGDGMQVNIDGDEIGGPLGALLGILLASGGMLIAAVVMVGVAVLLGVLFAGLGILMIGGLALLAVVLAACVSPLLLPLLIPIGIYWIFKGRSRRQQRRLSLENAMQQAV